MTNIILAKKVLGIATAIAMATIIGIGSFATVPQTTSKSISPLPVTFTPDTDANVVESGGTTGTSIASRQKVVVNLVLNTADDAQVALHVANTSEDRQIFKFKATAPSQVILDMEAVDACASIHGITAENEWFASIAGNSPACKFSMEVSVSDPGEGTITLDILRLG